MALKSALLSLSVLLVEGVLPCYAEGLLDRTELQARLGLSQKVNGHIQHERLSIKRGLIMNIEYGPDQRVCKFTLDNNEKTKHEASRVLEIVIPAEMRGDGSESAMFQMSSRGQITTSYEHFIISESMNHDAGTTTVIVKDAACGWSKRVRTEKR